MHQGLYRPRRGGGRSARSGQSGGGAGRGSAGAGGAGGRARAGRLGDCLPVHIRPHAFRPRAQAPGGAGQRDSNAGAGAHADSRLQAQRPRVAEKPRIAPDRARAAGGGREGGADRAHVAHAGRRVSLPWRSDAFQRDRMRGRRLCRGGLGARLPWAGRGGRRGDASSA